MNKYMCFRISHTLCLRAFRLLSTSRYADNLGVQLFLWGTWTFRLLLSASPFFGSSGLSLHSGEGVPPSLSLATVNPSLSLHAFARPVCLSDDTISTSSQAAAGGSVASNGTGTGTAIDREERGAEDAEPSPGDNPSRPQQPGSSAAAGEGGLNSSCSVKTDAGGAGGGGGGGGSARGGSAGERAAGGGQAADGRAGSDSGGLATLAEAVRMSDGGGARSSSSGGSRETRAATRQASKGGGGDKGHPPPGEGGGSGRGGTADSEKDAKWKTGASGPSSSMPVAAVQREAGRAADIAGEVPGQTGAGGGGGGSGSSREAKRMRI